nr:hypothetical protein [Escherichia coli]
PVLDSEGNTNISGVTVVFRAGEQEQTPPEGFESSGSETVLGTEVKYDTPLRGSVTLEFKVFHKGNQWAGNITDCTVIVTKKAASGISIR